MRSTTWVVVGALCLAAAGCADPTTDPAFRAGSSNLGVSGDGEHLFVADADNGELTRIHLSSGGIEAAVLGLEPTRLVQVRDLLFVTLRVAGEVAVLTSSPSGLDVVERIAVGGEPYGIVADPAGDHVYVAQSTADAVVEIDTRTFETVRKFAVPGQPRWLAMHPKGRALFVGCAMQGGVYRVDLRTGEVGAVELPTVERGDPETGEAPPMSPRITGDLDIRPEGDLLAIPALYVDHTSSVGGADPLDEPRDDVDIENPSGGGGYAAGDPEGLTRFNPAVVTVGLKGVEAKPRRDDTHAVLVSGRVLHGEDAGQQMFDTGFFDLGFEGRQGGDRVRGYLTSARFSADGHSVFATVEGGRAVAMVAARPVEPGMPSQQGGKSDPFVGDGAFGPTPRIMVGVDAGPTGLVDAPDGQLYTWSFLDRTVAMFDSRLAMERMGDMALSGPSAQSWGAARTLALGPSILPSDVQEGRRLFYASNDSTMAQPGAGVSCATCHFEGRNDGLTWTFDHGVRQTPSLAGRVTQTTPVTWTNSVDQVATEVLLTSQGRMGGHGITESQTRLVEAYIDWSRDVVAPDADADAVARGQAVFERDDVGCATCHSGARYTDNRSYDMVGLDGVNTPGLRGVVATAPYFHDGSAPTLADVIELADSVGMGHTAHLSKADKDDLEAYLRSL